jgi:hypothetical protein
LRLLKRGKIDELTDPRAYHFETAANTLADRARKRRSRHMEVHETFDPSLHPYEDFASDRVLIGEETLTRVSRALLELPERTHAIFILRRLEGMRYHVTLLAHRCRAAVPVPFDRPGILNSAGLAQDQTQERRNQEFFERSAAIPLYRPSSTSLTRIASSDMLNGLVMSCTPGSRRP